MVLSPAAQAVLDAFENASDGEYVEGVWVVNERTMLSAALRAAADQELEACCEWLGGSGYAGTGSALRAARRPKPPTLAEQATAKLDDAVMRGDCITTTDAMPSLRAALKRLAELENHQ
jgi:hypothetical protein